MTLQGGRARLLGLGLLLAGTLSAVAAETGAPSLATDTELATAGYYKVDWAPADVATSPDFELQEATRADFADAATVYRGPDRARTFTGRPDGTYYYRVRLAQSGAVWSSPLQVAVEHHPLQRAWLFFALGAVVFVATLALILFSPKGNTTA